MIAAIYARKSTDQSGVSDEQKSVHRQIEHAREYAARNGWTVADDCVFADDGISGAEFTNRPEYGRLMRSIEQGPRFQVLIMSEESRLGREPIETMQTLKRIMTARVRVFVYIDNREVLLGTMENNTMAYLRAEFAAEERRAASKRTRDAMERIARAGHVTGGRVFGYDNVPVFADGKRSHVERRRNETEAAVVRLIFQLAANGYGGKAIAKRLNEDRVPCPRSQQGRPASWTKSTVWEVLRRPLYRGEIRWGATKKRDQWGQKRPAARDSREWISVKVPALRIVPEALCQAVDARLADSHATYRRHTGGATYGRPVNGKPSRYLLTGLCQCGVCRGGLMVLSRSHGKRREFFYGCAYYHDRGKAVCPNGQVLPMDETDASVLYTLRDELLHPDVIDRALRKLAAKLTQPQNGPVTALEREAATLDKEIGNLAYVIASRELATLDVLIEQIKQRERRRAFIRQQLETLKQPLPPIDDLLAEAHRALGEWQGLLLSDVRTARPLLKALLVERIVFTPDQDACVFRGSADLGALVAGFTSSGGVPNGIKTLLVTPFKGRIQLAA